MLCCCSHCFLLDSKASLTEHRYIWRSLTLMYFLVNTIHIDCHLMCPQKTSVLPQRSFWRWAEWWPGSVDVAVWRWPAHSQRTGSRRKWQSGQFLHIMFVYIYFFLLKPMEWGCFKRSRSTGQRMVFFTWWIDECYVVSSVQASHQSCCHSLCSLVQLQTGSWAGHCALTRKHKSNIYLHRSLYLIHHHQDLSVHKSLTS